MPSQTNEKTLEMAIEKALTGTCQEELAAATAAGHAAEEPRAIYGEGGSYSIDDASHYNARYAIDERRFWEFLEATQAEELDKLRRSPDWKLKILERYDRIAKKYGLLRILRKGLEVDDAHLTQFYQWPMASSSAAVKENFEKMISVSRGRCATTWTTNGKRSIWSCL